MLLSLPPERQHGVFGPGAAHLSAGHVHGPTEAHPEALRQTAGLLQPSGALLFLLLLLLVHHRRFSFAGFRRHFRTCQEGLRGSQRHASGGVAEVQRGGLYDPDQLRGEYRDPAAQTDGHNPHRLAVHSSVAGEQPTKLDFRISFSHFNGQTQTFCDFQAPLSNTAEVQNSIMEELTNLTFVKDNAQKLMERKVSFERQRDKKMTVRTASRYCFRTLLTHLSS